MDAREPGAQEGMDGTASRPALPELRPAFFAAPELIPSALEAAHIGIWIWDIATNRMTWSSNLKDIHRLSVSGLDGTFSAFENHIHPADRADVVAAIQDAVRQRKPYRILYRLPPQPDGEEYWIEALGTVIAEEPTRMVGTCRDVTERVTLHRELRARASHQEAIARLGEHA